ncbi:MAG: BrnT family toxin [Bacteroidota bacterium]|jgi:uncharacterized DUF497 family protein
MNLLFQWDRDKALSNLRKHGVSFEEAKTVFRDELSVVAPDTEHSEGEVRYIQIGHSTNGRLLIVFFVEREDAVRIINARRPTRSERKRYEEGDF